jgi:hypothetical protein
VARSGLVLDGRGSTLRIRTSGSGYGSSAFLIERSQNITIRGFQVDGGNAATGTSSAESAANRFKSGAAIRVGSRYIEFDAVSWDRLYGFGIYINTLGTGSTAWPADITIRDSYMRGAYQAIALIAGRRVNIINNTFVDTVGTVVDLEPDSSARDGGGFEDVVFRGNTIDRYAYWLVAANPDGAVLDRAIMNRLTVADNHVIRGSSASDGGIGGLDIRANRSNSKTDFVIRNNRSDVATRRTGTVIDLVNVRNLTVVDNTQPIANGATFLRDSGTSGTRTVSGNDTTP